MDSLIEYIDKNTLDIDFSQDVIPDRDTYSHVISYQLEHSDFPTAIKTLRLWNTIRILNILMIINITLCFIFTVPLDNSIPKIIGVFSLISLALILIAILSIIIILHKMDKKADKKEQELSLNTDMSYIVKVRNPQLEKHFLLAEQRLADNGSDTNWKLYEECFSRIKQLEDHYGNKKRDNIISIVCDELSRVK